MPLLRNQMDETNLAPVSSQTPVFRVRYRYNYWNNPYDHVQAVGPRGGRSRALCGARVSDTYNDEWQVLSLLVGEDRQLSTYVGCPECRERAFGEGAPARPLP